MRSRKAELADLGDYAIRQLKGPVATNLRRKIAQWRDPRERLLRQRRRTRRASIGSAGATGVFGGAAVVTQLESVQVASDAVADAGTVGFGGLAVVTAITAIGSARRLRRLNRTPLPAPRPEPVELPSTSSAAYEPMRRLAAAEESLYQALEQLKVAQTGSAPVPDSSVADARATATEAGGALRKVAARLQAVEATSDHASVEERRAIDEDIKTLSGELTEGVEGYDRLVVAAGRAVAASSQSAQHHAIEDATDRLAGLASAMRELSDRPDQQHG